MALFGKKENKFYIVIDPYTEKPAAACESREVKQIAGVLPAGKFVECSSYEFFKYKEHNVVPDDLMTRPGLSAKEAK